MDTTGKMFRNQHSPNQYGQSPSNFNANQSLPSAWDGRRPISAPYAAAAVDWRHSHPSIGHIRLMMREEITKFSRPVKCNYQAPPKVHRIAAYLEGRLFKEAASLDEYMDQKTLHARVKNLVNHTFAEAKANESNKPVSIHQLMPDASCPPFYPSKDHIVGATAVSSEDYGRCSLLGGVFGLHTEFLAGQGPIIDGYSKGHDMLPAPFLMEQQPSRVFASDPFASLERIPGYSMPWDSAGAHDGAVIFPQVNRQNSYGAPVQDHGLAQKNLQCHDLRCVSPVEQRDILCHNNIRNVRLELPSNQFNPLTSIALKGTSTCSGSRVSAASNPSPPSEAQWVGCREKRKVSLPLVSSSPISGKSEVMSYVKKRLKMGDQFGSFEATSGYSGSRSGGVPLLSEEPHPCLEEDRQDLATDEALIEDSGLRSNRVSPLSEVLNPCLEEEMQIIEPADKGFELKRGLSEARQEEIHEVPLPLVSSWPICGDSEVMPDVQKRLNMGDQFGSFEATSGYSGSRSGGVPLLSEEPHPCLEEERQDLATDGILVEDSGLRSDRVSLLSEELNPCLEEERQITEPAGKGFKCKHGLSEASQEGIHEAPISGGGMITGASLLEYFTGEEIEMHLLSLKESSSRHEREIDAAHTTSQTPCQLCGEVKLSFAPTTMYCSSCNKVINYEGNYYTPREVGEKLYVCSGCYGRKAKVVQFRGGSISKGKLEKKKHNEEGVEEPWVQCERCQAWHHQICGLFNDKKNVAGNAEYICPFCCLKVINNDDHTTFRKDCAFSAKDLPRTKLSDHIERRLHGRLKQEREGRAKASGKNFCEVPGAEDLVVRVVLSLTKKVQVDKQFIGIFDCLNYPSELPYKSKVIALFQKIEGVDVLLFGMYVQEYGSDCSQPNNRCVYISYLDSVKYFRPDIKSASGESLRTFVYHEIMLGYFEYSKNRGFLSCYLWACPPTKGDDFLLYCHPKFQKNPSQKWLRKWYGTMFSRANDEKIVLSSTNLCEFYLTPSGSDKLKITAARLPYFEGDFWPSKLEIFLKAMDLEAAEESEKNNMSRRALKACKSPSNASSKDNRLMEKIGHSMKDNKDDFMIAHLQYVCTTCHEVILSGKRWFCDRCSKQKPQLCERCVDAGEVGWNAEGSLVCRAKHLLCEATVDPVPCDTEDGDITIENQLFENRHSFLDFCQENHYQFDTLRRAKHSTMMILYHLNEHKDQVAESSCSLCQGEILGPSCTCKICFESCACKACYVRQDFSLSHELTPSSSADVPAPEVQFKWLVNMDTKEILSLVVHCSRCIPSESEPCSYLQCSKIKGLFHHSTQCSRGGASKGCEYCQNVWLMLRLHAKECIDSDCRVPWCRKLRERLGMQPVKHSNGGIHKPLISA